MEIKDVFKNKVFWVAMIVMFLIIMNTGDTTKKESTGEWGRVGMGIAGIGLGIAIIWITAGAGTPLGLPIILGSGALMLAGGGGLFSGIAGLFTPDIGIPTWAYLLAGVVLLLTIAKKRN